jgi:CheY-like chemotaxis protein
MKLQVLLVEDNPVNRDLVLAVMEVAGHDVSVAESGAAFRRYLGSGDKPDIVLMDVLLPDADGYTLLSELRNIAWAQLPVVALTALALPNELEGLLSAGFDAVITKPIDTRMFAATVESYASKGRRVDR